MSFTTDMCFTTALTICSYLLRAKLSVFVLVLIHTKTLERAHYHRGHFITTSIIKKNFITTSTIQRHWREHIFPDASEYRGQFQNALPQRGMFYPPQQQQEMRRLFDHSILGAREPLWNLGSNLSLYENMPENPLPRFVFGKADCLAAVKSVQGLGAEHNSFDHITTVTARLVWARPIYADQPLWNASECRGKIVVCMRGPRPPAPPCNYSIKLFHCQNAGAAGVIFVDFDSFQKFTIVPRVEDGPIYEGGPVLKVRIPCMLTLTCYLGVLQEGALHTMTLASNVPSYVPPGHL